MKTILSINYQKFLLADGTNVNTLIKALGDATSVRSKDYGAMETFIHDGTPKIEIQVIQDKQVIDTKKLKRIPEKASPDCDGPALPLNE